jgi:hypothetical protein
MDGCDNTSPTLSRMPSVVHMVTNLRTVSPSGMVVRRPGETPLPEIVKDRKEAAVGSCAASPGDRVSGPPSPGPSSGPALAIPTVAQEAVRIGDDYDDDNHTAAAPRHDDDVYGNESPLLRDDNDDAPPPLQPRHKLVRCDLSAASGPSAAPVPSAHSLGGAATSSATSGSGQHPDRVTRCGTVLDRTEDEFTGQPFFQGARSFGSSSSSASFTRSGASPAASASPSVSDGALGARVSASPALVAAPAPAPGSDSASGAPALASSVCPSVGSLSGSAGRSRVSACLSVFVPSVPIAVLFPAPDPGRGAVTWLCPSE